MNAIWSRARERARAVINATGPWAIGARVAIIALVSTVIACCSDTAWYFTLDLGLIWRNGLPIALFILLIYGLSGRFLLSIVISSGITRAVYALSAVKVFNLNQPLVPGDLVLGKQVLSHMGFFAHYTGHRLYLLLLAVAAFMLLLYGIWLVEGRWPKPRSLARVTVTLLSAIALFTLYQGAGFWRNVYSLNALPGFQPWDPMQSVHQVGLMAGLVKMTQDSGSPIPQPDTTLVTSFARSHAKEVAALATRKPPAELPDIVMVQSEAFFDPGVMRGVNYGQFVPNFERIAATGITGSLTTPTYGGGTIRTEFETLTGYPMEAFPAVTYPYYGLAARWMPTVPHRLEAFGYSTTLFHPFSAGFWNRDLVMPQLGFQHSYYENDFQNAAHAGEYISDRALFNFVLAHLDNTETTPQYDMVITMENHGPWDFNPGPLARLLKDHPLPHDLSPAGTKEMTYYLSHLVNGDQALGDFSKALMARRHWTILIFYGDHLPALPHAFADLGFDDGKANIEEHTRYMLISNRPLTPQRLNLSAYELPSLLFDTVGLPEDGDLAVSSLIRRLANNKDSIRTENYQQVLFNAAVLEVSCKKKLSETGSCKQQTRSPIASAISN